MSLFDLAVGKPLATFEERAEQIGPIRAPHLPVSASMLSLWLLAKVFASGCAAMTGAEAVSNGVMAFREPTQRNAKRSLTIIIVLLAIFLAGIALLCRVYSIAATDPGSPRYQSILSQLTAAVMGRGWFYYTSSAPWSASPRCS